MAPSHGCSTGAPDSNHGDDMSDEEIKDVSSFWNQLKMILYYIVRLPFLWFDKDREK